MLRGSAPRARLNASVGCLGSTMRHRMWTLNPEQSPTSHNFSTIVTPLKLYLPSQYPAKRQNSIVKLRLVFFSDSKTNRVWAAFFRETLKFATHNFSKSAVHIYWGWGCSCSKRGQQRILMPSAQSIMGYHTLKVPRPGSFDMFWQSAVQNNVWQKKCHTIRLTNPWDCRDVSAFRIRLTVLSPIHCTPMLSKILRTHAREASFVLACESVRIRLAGSTHWKDWIKRLIRERSANHSLGLSVTIQG